MREIKAYHCDYCKKYSKSKGAMTRHEKECYHNPVTKACATCKFLEQVEETTTDEVFGTTKIVRPICQKGIRVSVVNNEYARGYDVRLNHHCELWQEKEDAPDE